MLATLLSIVIGTALAIDLPVVPSIPPGTVAPLPDDPLSEAKARFYQGDLNGARALLEPYVLDPKGWRQRSATRLLLGRVYMDLGLFNQASTQFYRVRRGAGGDAKVAAWYEAVADLQRGRPHATIKECNEYISAHKEGRRVSECAVLVGDAQAQQGRLSAARKSYDAFLENPKHKKQLREEEMDLRIALATAKTAPKKAIPLLQELAIQFRFSTTEKGALNTLEHLNDAGHLSAVVPTDPQSQMRHAVSLRRSGLAERAWAAFEGLSAQAQTDPAIAQWVKDNTRSFARSTRHPLPETLAAVAAYQQKNGASPNLAWTIFSGWRKAGRWDKAAKWGEIGLKDHGKHWPWRGSRDDVAHAIMLSGNWSAASEAWDAALKARNGPKNQALFFRSLTAHLAGDPERAQAGFSTLILRGGRLEMASRYWRIRSREAEGKSTTMADRTAIATHDKTGWYKLLLQPPQPKGEGWVVRDGRWHGEALAVLPNLEMPEAYPGVQVGIWPTTSAVIQRQNNSRRGLDSPSSTAQWSTVRWPTYRQSRSHIAPLALDVPTIQADLPDSYRPSPYFDEAKGLSALKTLSDKASGLWPDLKDVVHLAEAGLYDEAAPIVRAAFLDHKRIKKSGTAQQQHALLALNISPETWLSAALSTRDHHTVSREFWGKEVTEDREAYGRLQFPIAHAKQLWAHCQRWDVDPFLVLSIMRQESIYKPDALSPTGAIGLMQFIKGTGANVSALLGETLFSPHALYDPSLNLKYSVYYLTLLNGRFGGNFPIAVASYNGGPHHMSRAHRSTLGDLDLDAFVEMIPRREPRDYVKKVVGYYQQYVSLYAPDGAGVVLPKRLTHDDPMVVDF
jgi:soluble lytic murein transglycosylase-like protein